MLLQEYEDNVHALKQTVLWFRCWLTYYIDYTPVSNIGNTSFYIIVKCILDIASSVFMSYDLTEHVSYMFYRILYHFK